MLQTRLTSQSLSPIYRPLLMLVTPRKKSSASLQHSLKEMSTRPSAVAYRQSGAIFSSIVIANSGLHRDPEPSRLHQLHLTLPQIALFCHVDLSEALSASCLPH